MSKRLGMNLAALMAFAVCGAFAQSGPNMLVNLDATDFAASPVAWANKGDLGGAFMPVDGTGAGVSYGVVGGVNAVTLVGNRSSVLTNMVSPNIITGAVPWSWEIWVYNPSANASAEIVFTWTARENWPSTGAAGSCMEFRYGSDAGNAVEHYGSENNLQWGGAIPTVGQWHHVAVTRDSSGLERLFLDGRLRYSRVPQVLNLRDDVGFFTIGAVSDTRNTNIDASPFSGSIARLRIYDGALSTKTVLDNYLAECSEFGLVQQSIDQFWDGTPGAWEAWDDPANWLVGAVPVDNDVVYIDNKGKAENFGGINTFQYFHGTDGGFSMTGGLFTVLNSVTMANGPGRSFDFQLTGGKFNIPGNNDRHLYLGAGGGGAGYATIGGGSELAWLCVDKDIQLATGTGNYGFMEVLPNGLITMSNGWFYVNCNGVSTGEVIVAGGTIHCLRDNNVVVGQGRGAKGKFTLNSGSVLGANELRMSGDQALNASSFSEVYLNGGLLEMRRLVAYTPGENYFYLNGGTLRNRDSRQDFFQNLTGAYVQSGGAVFDIIAGTTIGVSQGLLEDSLSTGGGLVKTGPGILELRGVNTFTGDITVNEGVLLLRNGNALPGTYNGKILLENGASIGWEKDGGAHALLALLDKNSVGSILLFGADASKTIDLSQFPYLSIGSTGSSVDHGSYIPYTDGTVTEYRFTVIGSAYVYRPAIPQNGRVTLDATSTGFLDLYGDSSYTHGTTINGGFIVMYHENALGAYRGVRDIGIYNGAALVINSNIGQQRVQDVIDRIKTDSWGALLVGNPVNNYAFDLSALPGVSLGSDQNNARDFNGVLIPDPLLGYHIGGGRNTWNNSGLGFRNLPASPHKVVLDIPGSAQLVTNNAFAGGITVSNTAVLWFQNDTALGAEPVADEADYLLINGGALRPNPSIPRMATHPNRGFTVGDNGAILYPPGNRSVVWEGNLNGSGAITNLDGGTVIFGGAANTWDGELMLRGAGVVAVGWGNKFSWERDNAIQGDNGYFGVATDNDLGWDANFARPLGDAPISYYVPGGTSAPIGLRKLGAGTLTLDVPNTYTRDTQVESGTLKVGVANAVPWGGGKGNLNFISNNLYPLGALDINGFDVNVNGFSGAGSVTNSAGSGKTLTIGNNNVGGTFWGKVDPSVSVTKIGNNNSTQNFWKGAEFGNFTLERGPVNAGAATTFGDVSLKMVATTDNTGFNVGLSTTDIYGLTGEYYNFDYPELWHLISTLPLLDIDVFDALLAQYVPSVVASSAAFGEDFNAGWSDTIAGHPAAPGVRFPNINGFNFANRANHYGRWTGEFYAETTGDYVFATASDDGSAVYINRHPAITNSYSQGLNYTTNSLGVPSINCLRYGEPMHLEQGWHDIVVMHYQGSGGRGLVVFMVPPEQEVPTEGLPPMLPQALLRPYPVTARSLAGIPNSRTEVFGNAALLVASEAVNVYSGRLVSAATNARFIKAGSDDFIFVGQTAPEFNGQIVVTSGDLGLQEAAVSTRPIKIESGGALFAQPVRPEWGNLGLRGYYYDGNYGGGLADATAVANAMNPLQVVYVANTSQGGPDALWNSAPDFYYERETFPGPYSYNTAPVGEKGNFRGWYSGKFLALEAGEYSFGLHVDDRGDLYLNGERICVDSQYNQPERIATRYLPAGTHDLQVIFGQGGGGYFVRVRVAPPDGELMRLPNAWLRPSVSKAYGVEGNGIVDMRYAGSYLCMQIEEPQVFAGNIIGEPGSEIEKNGEATWTLIGDNDGFEGGWFVLQGALVVGDGGLDGTLGGNRVYVSEGAQLIFNRSDDIVYNGTISGKGEIISLGGRVTFTNFGNEFQGTFTSGDFVVEGMSTVLTPANLPPAGQDLDLRVQLGGGARLVVPADADPTLLMAPLTLADATVSLPYAENAAYYIETLNVAAGTVNQIGMGGPTGIYGHYYALPGGHGDATLNAFLTLETALAYLESHPLICKVSAWEAGPTFDFGSGDGNNKAGLLFPQVIVDRLDNFGAIYKGKIDITVPGEYRFGSNSDDNSMLYINGDLVVDNNGSHGMQWRYGTVTLTTGLHDFVLVYAQGSGGLGLMLDVALPGGASARLPNSMLRMDFADLDLSALSYSFTLEVGTLGVVEGPGTGLLDVVGGDLQLGGTLLLNNLFIESVGAVLATKGNTLMKGSHLHVTMGEEPPLGLFFKIADFTEAVPFGLPLMGKTHSLDGAGRGRLVQRSGSLYVSMVTGTVLILR